MKYAIESGLGPCYRIGSTIYFNREDAEEGLLRYISQIERHRVKFKEKWLYRAFLFMENRSLELRSDPKHTFHLAAIIETLDRGLSLEWQNTVLKRLRKLEEKGVIRSCGLMPCTEDELGRAIPDGAGPVIEHWSLYRPCDVWPTV